MTRAVGGNRETLWGVWFMLCVYVCGAWGVDGAFCVLLLANLDSQALCACICHVLLEVLMSNLIIPVNAFSQSRSGCCHLTNQRAHHQVQAVQQFCTVLLLQLLTDNQPTRNCNKQCRSIAGHVIELPCAVCVAHWFDLGWQQEIDKCCSREPLASVRVHTKPYKQHGLHHAELLAGCQEGQGPDAAAAVARMPQLQQNTR